MASPHRQLKSIRNPTPRPSGAFFISRASCNASVGAGSTPPYAEQGSGYDQADAGIGPYGVFTDRIS